MNCYCKKIVVVLSILCLARVGSGQQPAQRAKSSIPLTRPQPLCELFVAAANAPASSGVVPGTALKRISSIVTARGFQVDFVNWADGELAASRKDQQQPSNMDKVIVWLERDFQEPQSRMKIYLLYGRFEKFFGNTEGTRVVVDPIFEDQQIGLVKKDIIAHCLNGGNE